MNAGTIYNNYRRCLKIESNGVMTGAMCWQRNKKDLSVECGAETEERWCRSHCQNLFFNGLLDPYVLLKGL